MTDVARAGGRARSRRHSVPGLVALTMLLLCGMLAVAILRSQADSRSKIIANFKLRGQSSATLVSTYVTEQAERQKATAARFLGARRVSARRFELMASAFGSPAAVLLDSSGRVLDSVPADPKLLGRSIDGQYTHLAEAEQGLVGVSGDVPSAVTREAVTAVAVPFETVEGRRVFSVAYPTASPELQAFVDHAIAYPQHDVLLLDESNRVLAMSPASGRDAKGLSPQLARALAHRAEGSLDQNGTPSMFTSAPVAGTPWRMVIELPDYKLFYSIEGFAEIVPWIVLGLVTLLGFVLAVVFSRLTIDRARLHELSAELRQVARTDSLTGLVNRRGLTEHLTRAAAAARRRDAPLSVLMLDLDRFKEVNDTHGHDAGDRVLCLVADVLRDVLRADDVYGRLGGDEFMVVLGEADEEAARRASARLVEAGAACDVADLGLVHGIPISVGAATATRTTPEEIMRAADVELYRVKSARRAEAADAASRAQASRAI